MQTLHDDDTYCRAPLYRFLIIVNLTIIRKGRNPLDDGYLVEQSTDKGTFFLLDDET